MLSTSESVSCAVRGAGKKLGTAVHDSAQSCSDAKFAKACRGLQPDKTAEWLAAGAGCSVRTAGYILAGERDPTKGAIKFVISEILQ